MTSNSMNLFKTSQEVLNSTPGKLVGAAIVTAVIGKLWPFMIVENNQTGFKRRFGKVERSIVPAPDNAARVTKVLRALRPDKSGEPIPKMVKPGLRFKVPLSHSIEVVSTQLKTTKLGVVTVDRGHPRRVINPQTGELTSVDVPKVQYDIAAEIGWRVSPLGHNPYRAVDEVDDLEAAVTRICRSALGKTALWLDDTQSAKPELLTNLVNYHAYEQLLEVGAELVYVDSISDVRSFGEMVQPRGDSSQPPSPAILAGAQDAPSLHAVGE